MTKIASSAFFKPADSGVVYHRPVAHMGAVCFRPLNLSTDLSLLHVWVNEAYSMRFWQMNGAINVLQETYSAILQHDSAHSFIGLINNQPGCQIDLYAVQADELAGHITAEEGDCGLHLLMCPPRQMQRGWSKVLLQEFIRYYFLFNEANRLYAEPDQDNHAANQLAINVGFQFQKTIDLTTKTANLYCIDRAQYNRLFQ